MALTSEQLAKAAKLNHLKSLAARTKAVTDNLQTQIDTLDSGAIKSVKVNGTALTITENGVDILIGCEKQTVAETGYASTYVLKANGVAVGDKINIAKDWLLTGVTKGTVTASDKAESGKFENDEEFSVGDRYVDMEFNVSCGESLQVSLQNAITQTYINGTASLKRTTAEITTHLTDGYATGADSTLSVSWLPQRSWRGLVTAESTSMLSTSQGNAAQFSVSGEMAFSAAGEATLAFA